MTGISSNPTARSTASHQVCDSQNEISEQKTHRARFASLRGSTNFTYGSESPTEAHSSHAQRLIESLRRLQRLTTRGTIVGSLSQGKLARQSTISRDGGGGQRKDRGQSDHGGGEPDRDQDDEHGGAAKPTIKTPTDVRSRDASPENKLLVIAAKFPPDQEMARAAAVRSASDNAWIALLDEISADSQVAINSKVYAIRMDELGVQQRIGRLPQSDAITALRERARTLRETREQSTSSSKGEPAASEQSQKCFRLLFPLLLLHSRIPRTKSSVDLAIARQTILLRGAKQHDSVNAALPLK